MKKIISYLTSLFIIGAFFLFFTNCSEEGKSDSDLVGIWNVTNVDYDAYVGNMTVEDYYLNELEFTPEETAVAMAIFDDEATYYLESSMIEFEADFYYWTNIGDPAGDEGEWKINASETLITLDEETIWETTITVNSLTSNSLNISFTMEEEIDLDNDIQTPDEVVTFDMTLTLSK